MASVTITKWTTTGACSGLLRHIYRENKNYSNPDINRSLKGNGYIGSVEDAQKKIKDTIQEIDNRKPPLRKKQDRKTVASLNIPAPREGMNPTDMKKFFLALTQELSSHYHICGGAIHTDEVHEYIDPRDHKIHKSRWHMHLAIIPETEKGLNMKSWLTKLRYKEVNDICNQICQRELGFSYTDGSQQKSLGTVEQLKLQSAMTAIQELPHLEASVNSLKAQEEDFRLQLESFRQEAEKANIEANKAIDKAANRLKSTLSSTNTELLEKRSIKNGLFHSEDITVATDPDAITSIIKGAAALADQNDRLKTENKKLKGKLENLEEDLYEKEQLSQKGKLLEIQEAYLSKKISRADIIASSHGIQTQEIYISPRDAREFMKKLDDLDKIEKFDIIQKRAMENPELKELVNDLVNLTTKKSQSRSR